MNIDHLLDQQQKEIDKFERRVKENDDKNSS
jgi:hypothetical protein